MFTTDKAKAVLPVNVYPIFSSTCINAEFNGHTIRGEKIIVTINTSQM